jgi:ketosteroid isomerase-like protein
MSNEEENVQVVKNFFAAIGSGDKQALLALVDEGIEWIIPGEDWPLAGTHRGHAGVAAVLRKAAEEIEMTYPKPPEFVAQGDRVFVVGVATGTQQELTGLLGQQYSGLLAEEPLQTEVDRTSEHGSSGAAM